MKSMSNSPSKGTAPTAYTRFALDRSTPSLWRVTFNHPPISDRIDQAVLDEMAAGTPIGRFGASKDIAASIAHLFSDDGSFITGQVLAIDGGWSVS